MNIYEKLGVKTIINGAATLTILGGSIMPEEVLDAMKGASQYFVNIPELQKKAGDYIAKLTQNEAAFISDGAAAGMALASAAIIAGNDAQRRMQLPDSTGMKNEVLVCAAFNPGYSHAIKLGGGKIKEYGSKEGATVADLEAAFTDNTAAVFYFNNEDLKGLVPSIAQTAEIAHKHNVPVVVDAAAQLPPVENLWNFTKQGADLAIFSGGKGLRGPQASGLIVGKRAIIDVIATFACPNTGIGRPMKVGKEEIIGLLTAVEMYVKTGTEDEIKLYKSRVDTILDILKDEDAVELSRTETTDVGKPFPSAIITIKEGKLNKTAEDIVAELKDLDPAIYVGGHNGRIHVNPQTLLDGQDKIVADAIAKIIKASKV